MRPVTGSQPHVGHAFFSNFLQRTHGQEPFRLVSAGTIPLCNIAIALKVGTSLFMVFIILAALRLVGRGDRAGSGTGGGSKAS